MHYHKRAYLSVRPVTSSIGMYTASLFRNYEGGWGVLSAVLCVVRV